MIVRMKPKKEPEKIVAHAPNSQSLRLLQSGYLAFRTRLAQEIECELGMELEDILDEDQVMQYYKQGQYPTLYSL
jgi:hypothetical protein